MNNTKLLRAIGDIDESLILRADPNERRAPIGNPVFRPRWIRTLAACLAVAIIIGVPYSVKVARLNRPQVEIVDANGVNEGFTLSFTKAQSENTDSIQLPMMFGEDLTEHQKAALFPNLVDTHSVQATADYFYHDGSPHDVQALFTSPSGLTTVVRAVVGKAYQDYVLAGDATVSHVLGTQVHAGFFITKPNSKGQRNIIYFANFQMDGIGYRAELAGNLSEQNTLRKEFTAVIASLIGSGPADMKGVLPAKGPR